MLAADLHEQAGEGERAAELLGEAARRAIERGALSSAEELAEDACKLARPDGPARAELELTLLTALAMAGKTQRATEVGETLLRRLAVTDATVESVVSVRLALARIAVAAGQWASAREQTGAARAAAGDQASLDALDAHALIGAGQVDEAARLAARTLTAAERLDQGEIACESLEVIGRAARATDLRDAERAFERALAIAERDGLTLWRVRALHELATIDLMSSHDRGRIQLARQAAVDAGALATLAVIDLHICDMEALRGRYADAIAAAERCVELSRRLDLATAPSSLIHLAMAQARSGAAAAAEGSLAKAVEQYGDHPDIAIGAPQTEAILALNEADHELAVEHFDAALDVARRHPAAPVPYQGLWALLRTVCDRDGQAARDEVRAGGNLGIPWVRAQLGVADAVALGRAGRGEEAARLLESALDELTDPDDIEWLHLPRRLVAEAALRDGWGDPAGWLTEAMEFYQRWGRPHVARWCQDLLRTAGVRLPRKLRRDDVVPDGLRALGVTIREHQVLELVIEGLSNKQIGQRLYVSPRTVEKHVASLLARLGARTRAELAAIAAREVG